MTTELQSVPAAAPGARSRRLRGLEKAAVLLISVGPAGAAEVFRHLQDDEIEALSLAMAQLAYLDPAVTEIVHQEVVATVQAYDSFLAGGIEYAREVLDRALGPERAADISGRLATVIEKRPFGFLRNTPPERIVDLLRHESPQTIAVVVAHLHSTLAGQVLSRLPDALQAETALRIAQMAAIAPEVVRDIDRLMRQGFASLAPSAPPRETGVQALAAILSQGGRSTERSVLDGLGESDEHLAAELRQLLFTFEDIAGLDDRAIQLILREVDHKDLALALRGVTDELKQRILANLSTRAAEMLIDDLDTQPPQHRRVIEDAQGRVVAIVRRLEDAGAIIISRADEDPLL